MRWVSTSAGRQMPLDRDPDPTGNVVIEAGLARVMRAGEGSALNLDQLLWMPHFATCPGRARGRNQQARALKRTLERSARDDAAESAVDATLVDEVRVWALAAARVHDPTRNTR